jgi:hypothetical protein
MAKITENIGTQEKRISWRMKHYNFLLFTKETKLRMRRVSYTAQMKMQEMYTKLSSKNMKHGDYFGNLGLERT